MRRKDLKLKRSFGHPGSGKSHCPAEKVLAKACLHHNLNGRKGKKKNKGAGKGKNTKKRTGEVPSPNAEQKRGSNKTDILSNGVSRSNNSIKGRRDGEEGPIFLPDE